MPPTRKQKITSDKNTDNTPVSNESKNKSNRNENVTPSTSKNKRKTGNSLDAADMANFLSSPVGSFGKTKK